MSTDIREAVRDRYGRAAREAEASQAQGGSCCSPAADSGSACGCGSSLKSTDFGYQAADLAALPQGADLALGCGNPTGLASIREGDTVVDLGSGGGIDCFLASRRVGPTGRVIGVDMTPDMLSRARRAAERGGYTNVEFRLGEIENLPIADDTADLVISNCVVNLSPDKARVFAEARRVLKPGGMLTVSDIVLTKHLPPELARSVVLLTGCIAGAMVEEDYLEAIRSAGFSDVRVASASAYAKEEHLRGLAAEAGIPQEACSEIAAVVRSVTVTARA